MESLIKVRKLKAGDRIAAVNLSSGLAGEIPYRYKVGKIQTQETFGIEIVEMQHTLKDFKWTKQNPEARAKDFMNAFKDQSIQGVITTIGGDDSILILPYIDYSIIRNNPKPFIGFSDSTIAHLICYKAGITSFYGPSILATFAENCGILPYTKKYFQKAIFETKPIGIIKPSEYWTDAFLDWFNHNNQSIKRPLELTSIPVLIQGEGITKGKLLGGCIQTLITVLGTELWPPKKYWKDAIVFFDISESPLPINIFKAFLRNVGAQGIWHSVRGIILGRPGGNRPKWKWEEYERELTNIISGEFKCYDMPVLTRLDFGHTDPMMTLPYGAVAEINTHTWEFAILESCVF
ncbi:LD-carboxypeptidase [Chryseobacterium nematophagum]|uniref:LD-carboxypeptidase n=1 Tax=Chryseobacterium nematophagum TaxID=2305228 RepID=A0A3M7TFL5_9FLAO|nr:S66 peptidase family protein [Chryseobacterium nematophagum]RNA61419.1 LD-carboxypeptidase [Chryseobacterium nematophagum]